MNKAHYHATWEHSSTLAPYRGFRKLENYFRKRIRDDIDMARDESIPLEDKEKYILDRERDADALVEHLKVERVIGQQENEEGDTEYYVKCMSFQVLDKVVLILVREGFTLRQIYVGKLYSR